MTMCFICHTCNTPIKRRNHCVLIREHIYLHKIPGQTPVFNPRHNLLLLYYALKSGLSFLRKLSKHFLEDLLAVVQIHQP